MKSNRIKNIVIFAPLLLLMVSCKKSFFTSINQNPNVLSTVKPNLLLSTVEAGMGYTQGGDVARTACMMVQQIFGANSQTASFYIYGYNPGAFDTEWGDLYTTTLENNYSLMTIADAGQYNMYSGISRIIMAYNLQVMVDEWGAVPYSKAFQANLPGGSIHPTYDSAKALYDTIVSLINVGTTYLNNSSKGGIVPGADDVIYSGNAASWVKFGHAIKARLYIHQSKGNATMANNALSEIALSFASNTDNAQYIFGTDETAANPWYQYNRDRAGNIEYSTAPIATMLKQLNDPRYSIYLDPANEDKGLSNGHYGGLNSYYGSVNSPVEYITYDELLFMKAEATLNAGGTAAAAQVFYRAAITANMNKLGVSSTALATYLTANGTLSATTSTAIGQVATQEYLALYLNPEAWTLWRRTGFPTLKATAGTNIPRRLEYPQTEYNLNAANVPASTLFSPRIFWDN